ncbi:unnamed protein product [Cyprideis torosa]|uniref:tRNA (uracil(54)-C(5))-methyltransferase n=1 Tax=Cyprideis torosa TaxID=163714 RepID=A0A7R8ZLJ5_9CRUS|nr:unnamed protein product [Cyprideis torosa]CAG0882393.1 unnamed protein product [Cyprideis torosa]
MNDVEDNPSLEDPFAYLTVDEFTSENFKIEVRNVPSYFGFASFRKFLRRKMSLPAVKVKAGPSKKVIYVTFPSDEIRSLALEKLNGLSFKGNVLKAENAPALPDPCVKSRQQISQLADADKPDEDSIPLEERVEQATSPWASVDYEEQLRRKQEDVNAFLENLKSKGLPCDVPFTVDAIRGSPQIDGYRNKAEFTIGFRVGEPSRRCVGFRVKSYKDGEVGVGPVYHLRLLSPEMKEAVKVFEEGFIECHELAPYNPVARSGCWKQLTLRQNRQGQLMAIVFIQPLPKESPIDEEQLKQQVKDFFSTSLLSVVSLFFCVQGPKKKDSPGPEFELLSGATHLQEDIGHVSVSVSPEDFLQCNTSACEVLYQTIEEAADLHQESSTLLDICCGIGTIGLFLAKRCASVLGVESVRRAVEDARLSAQRNEISNASFFAGKAEDLLHSLHYKISTEEAVAVLDPPRNGLHAKFIKGIRLMRKVKRLVYVACDMRQASPNLRDLASQSASAKGQHFILRHVVPVDLFPHTKGVELVLVFERPSSVSPVAPRRELKHSIKTEESDAPAEKRPHL